jgi:hypothetical protein
MVQQATAVAVLARFPDVNDGAERQRQADESKYRDLLGSSGRWIGQAMSVKLLAGITLFLLVGAVLPFCLSTKSPTTSSPVGGDALSTSQPKQAESPTVAASTQTDTGGAAVAHLPAARVSATSDQFPPPATLPSAVAAQRPPSAAPSVAESLMSTRPTAVARREPPPAAPTVAASGMSDWPPRPGPDMQPGRPGADAPASNANRGGTSSAGFPEYEADARGHRPGEPASARLEGTIEGTKR